MGHNIIHNKLRHRKFCNITGDYQCMGHGDNDQQIEDHHDISLIDDPQRRFQSLSHQCQQRHRLLPERGMDAGNDTTDIKQRKNAIPSTIKSRKNQVSGDRIKVPMVSSDK